MICELCKNEKQLKSNTHYLTDFIIRTALNYGGSKIRNRGYAFGFDSSKNIVEFQYQQVDSEKVEKVIGRVPTDDENKKAEKQLLFSVNDSFCKDCEDKFTIIENKFSDKLIKNFRNNNLKGIKEINLGIEDSKILRLFFLMQFWRVSVCSSEFILPYHISEFIRTKIFNLDYEGLQVLPLSITYLETIPNDVDLINLEYKTSNVVNAIEGENPYLIFMNDFVLQLFDGYPFTYFDFFGLNDVVDYELYLNYNSDEFKVKVFSNEKRINFLNTFWIDFAKKFMNRTRLAFYKRYIFEFCRIPSDSEIYIYGQELVKNNDYIFIEEKLNQFNNNYFKKLAKLFYK
jgi:hypothetical protein